MFSTEMRRSTDDGSDDRTLVLQDIPRIVQSSREFALLGKYRASRQSYQLAIDDISNFLQTCEKASQVERWRKVIRDLKAECKIIEELERNLIEFKTPPGSKQDIWFGNQQVSGEAEIPHIVNRKCAPNDPVVRDPDVWPPPTPKYNVGRDPDVWPPPTPSPNDQKPLPRRRTNTPEKKGNLPTWARGNDDRPANNDVAGRLHQPIRQPRAAVARVRGSRGMGVPDIETLLAATTPS